MIIKKIKCYALIIPIILFLAIVDVTTSNGSAVQAQENNSDISSIEEETNFSTQLQLKSGNKLLEESFQWARDRALGFKVTKENIEKIVEECGQEESPRVTDKYGVKPFIPAYWGSYTNRQAFCARDICHQIEAGHLLGLDLENWSMLNCFAKGGNENINDPYWPKWSYDFVGDPYYMDAGWRELPAPFEIVERAYEQYLWTGDRRWINDPEMFEYYSNIMTKFLEIQDINNNGVADEKQGLCTFWEQEVDDFIEAGDSFGSQYAATLAYSKILEARGDTEDAKEFEEKANQLREYFDEHWYSEEDQRYIRGFDEAGNFKADWGHENSFFMPLKCITDQGFKVKAYLEYIQQSVFDMEYNGNGLNIEAKTYLPEMFYKHGENAKAWNWHKYIMKSRNKYPEVSFLTVSNTIVGMMGVRPNAPENKVSTAPRLTQEVPWVQVDNIPIGENLINLKHEGNRKSSLTNVEGPTITWEAQFYGAYPYLKVNETEVEGSVKKLNGKKITFVEIQVNTGETVVVEAPDIDFGYEYLSDIEWNYAENYNEIFKDRSQQDSIITMYGHSYDKGISVRGDSTISYELNGDYSSFTADVGLEDELYNEETVIFKVFLDGKEIFNSGEMTKDSGSKQLNLNISGGEELKLITENPHNENFYYSAAWCDAVIYKGQSEVDESVASIALKINGLKIPLLDDKYIQLPEVPEGFNIEIKDTSNESIITKDGEIIFPDFDTTVSVIFNIIKNIDGTSAESRNFVIKVPAKIPDTIELAAKRLREIPAPTKDDKFIKLPDVWDGFSIKIKTSSNEDVIALDGALYPKKTYEKVAIVLEITKIIDGSSIEIERKLVTVPSTEFSYLSNHEWDYANTEFSEVNKDKNVSYKDIVINGEYYEKGIGIHANGEIQYTIDQKYKTFVSDIGIDDSITGAGSVVFYIYGDGEKLYESQIMTSETPTENIKLDINGIDVLKLVVDSIADGISSDHASWGGARLYFDEYVQENPTPPDEDYIYLGDLQWIRAVSGWGNINIDRSVDGNRIKIGGETYEKGIGFHAAGELVYNLDGKYSRFTADIGVDDEVGNEGTVVFEVFGDGRSIYYSNVMIGEFKAQRIDIDVTGVKELKIELRDYGDGISNDHASIGDPKLYYSK